MLALATDRSLTPKGRRVRESIVAHAETLLAARGFHGTSMRDVAAAARLPLATLVYHFARKEQLYAAVLGAIGDELVRDLAAIGTIARPGSAGARSSPERSAESVASPGSAGARSSPEGSAESVARPGSAGARSSPERSAESIDALAVALVGWTSRNPQRVRLLVRELLDNPVRVSRASHLPLAPFLERASRITGSEVAVLHAVGGLSYVIAARPTVDRIVGSERAKQLAARAERDALAFARRVLGESHVTRSGEAARPARPRAPRPRHHRRGARPIDPARRSVRR